MCSVEELVPDGVGRHRMCERVPGGSARVDECSLDESLGGSGRARRVVRPALHLAKAFVDMREARERGDEGVGSVVERVPAASRPARRLGGSGPPPRALVPSEGPRVVERRTGSSTASPEGGRWWRSGSTHAGGRAVAFLPCGAPLECLEPSIVRHAATVDAGCERHHPVEEPSPVAAASLPTRMEGVDCKAAHCHARSRRAACAPRCCARRTTVSRYICPLDPQRGPERRSRARCREVRGLRQSGQVTPRHEATELRRRREWGRMAARMQNAGR